MWTHKELEKMVVAVDKEVRFDCSYMFLKLRPGEKIIDRLSSIEDTKGNSGDIGAMVITNLRILWYLISTSGVNLSIGYDCIVNTSTTVVNSHLKGHTEALHILTIYNKAKFEFIFTNLVHGNLRHFTSVMGVHKAYVGSKLYRELRLRSSLLQNKQLKMLPNEQIFINIQGVWNLSSDQGNVGTLIITNIRVVWFADINENFNISLPYIQIDSIKIQESKFGQTLIIVSQDTSGGYVLGFKVDNKERLQTVYKEITTLFQVSLADPVFGVNYSWTKKTHSVKMDEVANLDDLQELCEDESNEMSNAFTIYMADTDKPKESKPKYYPELGLSMEPIGSGFTIQKLWDIIPQI